MDDGSSHWTYTNNVLAYGAFGNWLGGNNQVRQNFLLRADLSGTDDITIDSPVCHWSMFVNPAYWQQHGSNNSFTNNTCLHWFGDIYAYGQYWAPGASSSGGGGGGGGGSGEGTGGLARMRRKLAARRSPTSTSGADSSGGGNRRGPRGVDLSLSPAGAGGAASGSGGNAQEEEQEGGEGGDTATRV